MDTAFSLPGLMTLQAQERAESIALLAPGRNPLTYGRLFSLVHDSVQTLNALGIGRGDRVAVVLPDGIDMATAFLTVSAATACAPLNPNLRTGEFEALFRSMRVKAVVLPAGCDGPAFDVARALDIPIVSWHSHPTEIGGTFELHGNCSPSFAPMPGFAQTTDTALLLHTSGTTGRPKLVPLTHENLCQSAQDIRAAIGLSGNDRCLNVMPLHYIHGLSTIYASLAAGGSVVCLPQFEAPRFFELMEEFRPTWYTAAPTLHQAVLEQAVRYPEVIARCPLRFVRSASSGMPPQTKREIERVFGIPHVEAYGMTETSPQIASNRLSPEGRREGSVGRAAGPEVGIMEDAGTLLPALSVGEVVVRGANVMGGYLDNPEANAAAFTNGWFRTGDQGYLDQDGFLFITGRIKEIINRGGEKIAPREVDEVLMAHPTVARAVTFPLTDHRLGEEVMAAVVLKSGACATSIELRRFVAARLADYKVPREILVVETLPTGTNGKLQRIGMAAKLGLTPREDAAAKRLPFVGPRTETERLIANIWQDLLHLSAVSVEDPFSVLGGDSLLATRVLARIHSATQVRLSLIDFYETPTVAGLARKISEYRNQASLPPSVSALRVRKAGTNAPLSSSQQGLWFLDQLYPGNAAYNMHRAVRLRGPLDIPSLHQSIHEVVRRHEALRTVFPAVEGRPVVAIREAEEVTVETINLRALNPAAREVALRKVAALEAGKPFSLACGPLFRAKLVQMAEDDHALLLCTHHIVADGWSLTVLLDELAVAYNAAVSGNPCPLPDLSFQFADFARWQQDYLDGERLDSLLGYWKERLNGIPPQIDLPFDRPRPTVPTFKGAKHYFRIREGILDGLNALCAQEDVTPYMALLAAFGVLLARYSGQQDIVVGSPFSNRLAVETEPLIGFFNNTLVLRVEQGDNLPFRALLGRVRETVIGASAHQELPFELLVRALQPTRDTQRMALFQVNFRLQNMQTARTAFSGLTTELLDVDNGTAKFDLACELAINARGLGGYLEYSADLFDTATVARIAQDFEELLSVIVTNPDVRLHDLHQGSPSGGKIPPMNPIKSSPMRGLRDMRRKAVDLSQSNLVETTFLHPEQPFPIVFRPAVDDVDLAGWAADNRDQIETTLLKHGAILFRGFNLESVADFERVALAICPDLFPEYGDLPREGQSVNIYTSTPYPQDQMILFHNESSHLHQWPMRQFFFCLLPSLTGGETPLLDCRSLCQKMDLSVLNTFREKGLMYIRNFAEGIDVSWQQFFHTSDPTVVEEYCRNAGLGMEWKPNNGLKIFMKAKAVLKHPKTGEEVFFNQVQLHHPASLDPAVREAMKAIFSEEDFPRSVCYGDGTPIEDSTMAYLHELFMREAVIAPWQKGDLILLDNMLTSHARMPFSGPRKIVVAMGEIMGYDKL